MNSETKRLAIIATVCFFPTAVAGWLLYPKNEKQALAFFRFSIFFVVCSVLTVGILVVIKGGQLIKPMGSFF